uniref:MFS domain-containing protein n=2 Tax=Caenorhabditis japonica TaxID=281687 RepID=A0A8R1E2G2_CAEJA
MHIIPPGIYRVDVLILISYQMCHFFSIQQLFPIFLNYTPKTACVDTAQGRVCYDVPKSKCLQYNEFPNLCANLTGSALSDCHVEKSHSYYQSAAMEFEIYCRPGWKDFRPAFVQYVGVLIGNIILGYVADQMGRKKTFILSMLIGIPALSLSATFNSIAAFYFFRALTGIGIAGTMIVGWAYFSELVSPHQRFKLRTFSNWANARIMLTLVALFTGEWRLSSHVSACISLITLAIVYFVLPESHIWLRKKGRYQEAEESRKRIADLAGLEFEPMPPPPKADDSQPPEPTVNICTVFADPQLRKNILILWLMWFVTGMTAYLTDLCGGDMTKNFWIGQFLSGILLSVVRIFMGFADGYLPWMGRRFVLLCSQSLAIVFFGCVISFLYAGEKGQWYYTAAYLAAFVFTSIVWEPCYLCASELMPTDVRATSTASCSIVGRFANIGASMLSGLKTVYEPGVHMISMSLGLTNIIAAYFLLQETKNCSLDKAGTAASKPVEKANEQEMKDLINKTDDVDVEKK